MIMYFDGKLSENAEKFGQPFINAIDFINKRTGKIITIDRDESDISWDDDGTFSARWKGCYLWNGRSRNYDICASDMLEHNLHSIDFDEDDFDFDEGDKFEFEITNYGFA